MIRPLGGPRRGRLDQVTTARPSATELDARTPADRDRVIDAVRAASILVVVLGHWTMAAPERVEGSLRLRNVLEVATWAQPLTWLFQVMPLFFLAAGFANHRSLAPRADGTRRPVAAYLAGRVDRVLRPTLIFLAVWLVGAWVAVALGAPERALDAAGTAAAMPLWFLAIYLLLALLAPAQLGVHRRWPLLLPTVLPVGVLLLDQAQGTGWAALAFGGPIFARMAPGGFHLVLAGGALYTVGVAYLMWESLPFHVTIWHVFVLTASITIYAAMVIELGGVAAA